MVPLRSSLWIFAVLVLCSVRISEANIIDCVPPEPAPFIVNLNEPDHTGTVFESRQQMLGLFNRLHDHLDQKRDLEMAGISAMPFRVARCEGRKPKPDGSEFTSALVNRLLNEKVVIEIWGQLGARRSGRGNEPTAQMNYLVLPARRAGKDGRTPVPSLHRFNYPDRDIKSDDYVALISNQDLLAFITAAIGIRAFDNDQFQQAHEALCKASAKLEVISRQLALADNTRAQSGLIDELRAYAVSLARTARLRIGAATGKTVNASVLLQDPASPCGK